MYVYYCFDRDGMRQYIGLNLSEQTCMRRTESDPESLKELELAQGGGQCLNASSKALWVEH